VRVDSTGPILVKDRLQEPLQQDLTEEVGDFVIKRRDQLYAYQLAVVVDDAHQGVNQVVRGSDLYDSTPRQVYLQRLLGLETPEYAHIPVITNAAGQKLSKQTFAPPLDDRDAAANLRLALKFLGQTGFAGGPDQPERLLQAAAEQWQLDQVPARMGIPEDALC
jgi:glutamyl-Q tRNA(Asp) synthetase